jgi:hypothetical protein
MPLVKCVLHPDCLAKYVAVYLKMSRSSVARLSSAFKADRRIDHRVVSFGDRLERFGLEISGVPLLARGTACRTSGVRLGGVLQTPGDSPKTGEQVRSDRENPAPRLLDRKKHLVLSR